MHIRIHSIRKVKISSIFPTTKATATDQKWRWKRTTIFTRTSSRSSRSWPNCKYRFAKTRRTFKSISIYAEFCRKMIQRENIGGIYVIPSFDSSFRELISIVWVPFYVCSSFIQLLFVELFSSLVWSNLCSWRLLHGWCVPVQHLVAKRLSQHHRCPCTYGQPSSTLPIETSN